MSIHEKINTLLPIIFPKFCLQYDQYENELVFLQPKQGVSNHLQIFDKTQCEALQNHVHLFDHVPRIYQEMNLRICRSIAENLWNRLKESYPTKHFVVYLHWNPKGSSTVRFHQLWADEEPYFDLKNNSVSQGKLFVYSD